MDAITNPFSPGAGSKPPELVGRDAILDDAKVLLGRAKAHRSAKNMILIGLRGVGKTVLLNELQRRADKSGYCSLLEEARENQSLAQLLAPALRKVLLQLSTTANASDAVRRGLQVLRNFIGTFRVQMGDVSVAMNLAPLTGQADSGDLEADLPDLFVAVANAAASRDTVAAVMVDEIQYLSKNELAALLVALHKVQQQGLPLALIAAGLPVLPAMAGEAKSYAERLLVFPEVGPLNEAETARALGEPARGAGANFTEDAMELIYRQTQGYPYFVQEWGSAAWNIADGPDITRDDVNRASALVRGALDRNFFRVRFDRLTDSEKRFLWAMAKSQSAPVRTGHVAEKLKVKVSNLGPARAALINKGMVYSPAHGELAFTVPLFGEFILRHASDVGARARGTRL